MVQNKKYLVVCKLQLTIICDKTTTGPCWLKDSEQKWWKKVKLVKRTNPAVYEHRWDLYCSDILTFLIELIVQKIQSENSLLLWKWNRWQNSWAVTVHSHEAMNINQAGLSTHTQTILLYVYIWMVGNKLGDYSSERLIQHYKRDIFYQSDWN